MSNAHAIKPFMIGLGGDSGSGKRTIGRYLEMLIGKERLFTIGMDGYHRWDREGMKKQTLTHLNPEANKLDLACEHAWALKKGETIKRVIYDHSTGKFTEPQEFVPKEFVMIRGLHPLHLSRMREVFDFSIFVAPDGDILKKWKIHRDTAKRGYSKEEVLDILTRRKADSVGYIRAQEQYADLVINYFELGDEPEVHKMDLGVSFIFKNPKIDLKLMSKWLNEVEGLQATLEGTSLTVIGEISAEKVEELADRFFEKSPVFGEQPEWLANSGGLIQLIMALEVDRRWGNGG